MVSMRLKVPVATALDALSSHIRVKQYVDADGDTHRHYACCTGLLVGLVGVVAYMLFVIVSRPLMVVSVAAPSTWDELKSQGGTHTCACDQNQSNAFDLLEVPQCTESSGISSSRLLLQEVTQASIALFVANDTFQTYGGYKVPVEEWDAKYLMYPNQEVAFHLL